MARIQFALLFFVYVFPSPIFAQQANPTATGTKDPQAIAIVQSAINALGGANSISGIQDSTVQGLEQNAEDSTAAAGGAFTWELAGSQFRYEVDGDNGHVLVSNNGNPQDTYNGSSHGVLAHVARASMPFHLPGTVLLSELSGSQFAISFIGAASVNGTPAIQIHICDSSDAIGKLVSPQDWYFDSITSLPVRVEYRIPFRYPEEWSPASINFSDYRSVSGIGVPFRLQFTQASNRLVASVSSVKFNTGLSSAEFGGQVQ